MKKGKEKQAVSLENHVSFSLYATAKEMVRACQPELSDLGLTYTQYLAMTVIWETKTVHLKTIGEAIFLDSGTLTPLLRKLEAKGLITRERLRSDERAMSIGLTAKGKALQKRAKHIPELLAGKLGLTTEELATLQQLMRKSLVNLGKR